MVQSAQDDHKLSDGSHGPRRSVSADEATQQPSQNAHGHHDEWRRRHTNAHSECGRHTDDWLFGGFSIKESLKKWFFPRHKP